MDAIPVFIGYDPRESAAFYTCQQSILEHTDRQVAFYPVRGERRDGSNDFIYARFLVPYLTGYRGHAIFLDGDMIVRGDIGDLWDLRESRYIGVSVVKHDYQTRFPVKYLGNPNPDYPRKNWSSVVLWNCGFMPNRVLTPEYVAKAPGSFLHRFAWLRDEQIGSLPDRWNRLVMEQLIRPDDELLHYTIGTPCFAEYADCDGAEEWHATFNRAIRPLDGPRYLRKPEDDAGDVAR